MSIVGYTAASGVFLDIHPFLHGLAKCLDGPDGPELQLSQEMYAKVDCMPDPQDPTEIMPEYYQAWCTQSKDWKSFPPPLVDKWDVKKFHVERVSF